MNDIINFEDLFGVVVEPENSKNILLELQHKYKMTSMEFITCHVQGLDCCPQSVVRDWLFHLKLFQIADGNMMDLLNDFQC